MEYLANIELQIKGWTVLRIWEHEVKNDFNETVKKIEDFIEYSKQNEIK